MNTAVVRSEQDSEHFSIIEQVVISGDLAKLSPQHRVSYYNQVCESVGLNPFTQPFAYITLNGKLTLYARKDATEQLRKLHGISITSLAGKFEDDLYIVIATAQGRDGRIDQATGAVSVAGLRGEAKANAIMKGETKAKRRVTLSMAGLGWLDESETESIPGAQRVYVDSGTGEIVPQHRQIETKSEPPAHRAAPALNGASPSPDDILADKSVADDVIELVCELRSQEQPGSRKATAKQHQYAVSIIDGITGKDTHRPVFRAIFGRDVTAEQPLTEGAFKLILKYMSEKKSVKEGDAWINVENADYSKAKVDMIGDVYLWTQRSPFVDAATGEVRDMNGEASLVDTF